MNKKIFFIFPDLKVRPTGLSSLGLEI